MWEISTIVCCYGLKDNRRVADILTAVEIVYRHYRLMILPVLWHEKRIFGCTSDRYPSQLSASASQRVQDSLAMSETVSTTV
jgi:hypothetical protein